MQRSLHFAAAAAAFTALTAPPTANAARHVVYAVDLEGTYAYSISSDHRETGFRRQTSLNAKGVFVSRTGELSFLDGAADNTPGSRTRADLDVLFRSSGSQVETSDDEHGLHDVRTCVVEDRPLHGQEAQGWVQQSLLQPLVPGAPVAMDARIAHAFAIPFKPSDRCPEGTGAAIGSDADETFGRLDAAFELPSEAIGPGKTIQLLRGPTHESCPGSGAPDVVGCTFTWEATVTLTKVLDEELGGTTPARTPAPLPTVPPIKTVPPATAKPRVRSKRATADAKAKTVAFTASCAAGCSGTATVTAPGVSASKQALTFSVPAGSDQVVRVSLPAKTRAALRRAGRGQIAVRLAPLGGGAVVRSTLPVRIGG